MQIFGATSQGFIRPRYISREKKGTQKKAKNKLNVWIEFREFFYKYFSRTHDEHFLMFIKQRVIGKCVHSPHIPKQTAVVLLTWLVYYKNIMFSWWVRAFDFTF